MRACAANDAALRAVGDSDGDRGFPAMSRAERSWMGSGCAPSTAMNAVSLPCLPAKYPAETAPALLAGSQGDTRHVCPVCGVALSGRQRACSGRCRAKLSRLRRDGAQALYLREWAVRAFEALAIV